MFFINQKSLLKLMVPWPSIPPITGCGRSGTFIALDQINESIESSDVIDIRGTVATLRSARPQMVQTYDQYLFIHLAAKVIVARELLRRRMSPEQMVEEEKEGATSRGGGGGGRKSGLSYASRPTLGKATTGSCFLNTPPLPQMYRNLRILQSLFSH